MKKEGDIWFQKQFKENLENENLKSLQLPEYDLSKNKASCYFLLMSSRLDQD